MTTNLFGNYDEAILRRIARHIEFALPNVEMRERLFRAHLPNAELVPSDLRQAAIKAGNAYPAFTLAMAVEEANRLLVEGWPNAKPIDAVPEKMMAIILVSEGRCICGFVSKK